MLKSLSLENFTVFQSAHFEFSEGINVIIGENGTGKTHVLKAGYCLNRAWPDLQLDRLALTQKRAEVYFEKRLMGLFQPEDLGCLIRRGAIQSRIMADIVGCQPADRTAAETHVGNEKWTEFSIDYRQDHLCWNLSITNGEETGQVLLDTDAIAKLAPMKLYVAKSIFIPSKEIVSFYEGLGGLLDQYEIKLDAIYRDLVVNFDFPELSNVRLGAFNDLEDVLGGFLKLEGRKLIFVGKDGRKTDPPLLAEGLRKLAILPYLIRNGVIHIDKRIPNQGEALFWDEPEAIVNYSN
jgi:energy-coupling factor transporter ATP-binding protein EcfA2